MESEMHRNNRNPWVNFLKWKILNTIETWCLSQFHKIPHLASICELFEEEGMFLHTRSFEVIGLCSDAINQHILAAGKTLKIDLVLLIADEVPEQRLVFKYDAAVDGQNPVPLGIHKKQCDFLGWYLPWQPV